MEGVQGKMVKKLSPKKLKGMSPPERLKAMDKACDRNDKTACKMLKKALYGGVIEKESMKAG